MNELLQTVNAVEGVAGCFVCDAEGRLLAHEPQHRLDSQAMARAARVVAETAAGLAGIPESVSGHLDLVFSEGRLVVRPAGSGFLAVLCVPQINLPLLILRTNMALRAIERQIAAAPPPPATAPIPAPPRPAGVREALREAVRARLGARAGKAIGMLDAAGESREELVAACAQVARFTQLFLDRAKGEALEREMNTLLLTRRD